MMDVIAMLRDASALRAVKHAYGLASEHHARKETENLLAGEDRAADIHHRRDLLVCRALMAETFDPEPREAA